MCSAPQRPSPHPPCLPHSSEAKCSGSAIGTFPGRAHSPGGRHSLPVAPARSPAVPGTEPGLPPALRRTDLAAAAHWALDTWWEVGQGTGFKSFTFASVTPPDLYTPICIQVPLRCNISEEVDTPAMLVSLTIVWSLPKSDALPDTGL